MDRAMRRTGFGAAVLLCTLVLSHAAVADRDGSRAGVAGRVNAAAGGAALPVPRFSTAWLDAGKNPFRMVAADLNGDGKADLAWVDRSAATVSVRFGDGTGQFGPRTAYRTGRYPLGLVASDLNGDGNLDLASASTGVAESITVFINRGAGRFRRAGAYAAGREACGIAAGDVNGDGIVDLLSAHARHKHFTVLLGRGAGAFGVAHRYRGGPACDVAAVDLNSDGKLDVVLPDRGPPSPSGSAAAMALSEPLPVTNPARRRSVSPWPISTTTAGLISRPPTAAPTPACPCYSALPMAASIRGSATRWVTNSRTTSTRS